MQLLQGDLEAKGTDAADAATTAQDHFDRLVIDAAQLARTPDGLTGLDLAILHKNYPLAHKIIEYEVNARSIDNLFPASRLGQTPLVSLLDDIPLDNDKANVAMALIDAASTRPDLLLKKAPGKSTALDRLCDSNLAKKEISKEARMLMDALIKHATPEDLEKNITKSNKGNPALKQYLESKKDELHAAANASLNGLMTDSLQDEMPAVTYDRKGVAKRQP